jgi:hypothetical protein
MRSDISATKTSRENSIATGMTSSTASHSPESRRFWCIVPKAQPTLGASQDHSDLTKTYYEGRTVNVKSRNTAKNYVYALSSSLRWKSVNKVNISFACSIL